MLIITRRPGEKIMVGDDVVVEVIEVSGSSVRIGIAAPKSIPVYREEIWAAVQAENKAAAQGAIAYFGTYEVDEPNKALTMKIEYSSFPNFNGSTQRRDIKLENDELTITNTTGASGGTAYITWKRSK